MFALIRLLKPDYYDDDGSCVMMEQQVDSLCYVHHCW